MICRKLLVLATLVGLALVGQMPAADSLPVVEGISLEALQANGRQVLAALADWKQPLPAATEERLKVLVRSHPQDAEAAAAEIQRLLDAHCLIAVTISPESRVKARRGPARAELRRNQATAVLVKVYNEAGVTHPLAVRGPQVRPADRKGGNGWLEAAIVTSLPLQKKLSGRPVEYVLMRLKAHQAGKREATLKFDVGQGTQDLGFRAEVPVLFTVRPAR